jgi:BirA family biotin operon repressor/biotin-[acetyl-CoA-carboxylase] ligase
LTDSGAEVIRVAPLPDDFARWFADLRSAGRLGSLASSIVYYPTIGSTNDAAAALASSAASEGAIVIAEAQTRGRGRRGSSWFSPPSSGLYVSVVLAPGRAAIDPERATGLVTLAAGVALAEAVETMTGLLPAIKWPNDLLVGRRKLAGILAEALLIPGSSPPAGVVILGYGLNVGPMSYPAALADRATSLELELGRAVDRAALLAESVAALAARYDDLLRGRFDAILDRWRRRAPGSVGAPVSWASPSGRLSGTTAGIDDRGALLVRVGSRIERIVAGDVTWL